MSGTFMNFQCLGSKERSIQAGDLDQEVSKIAHRTEKCVHFVYSRGAQRTNLHFLTFSLPKRYPLIVALLRRRLSNRAHLSALKSWMRKCGMNLINSCSFAGDNGCSQYSQSGLSIQELFCWRRLREKEWVIGLISGLTVSIFRCYAGWSDSRRFSSWL